jgi:hypothetical protein
MGIDNDDWADYCDNWKKNQLSTPTSTLRSPPNVMYNSNSNNQTSPTNFSKNIKKDHTQYDILKDDCHFNNWQRSFMAVAHTHELEDALTPDYVPGITPDKQALWWKNQQFVYSVFDMTLN